jgi:alpha-tubulin suppressor-like RCC1 family protein
MTGAVQTTPTSFTSAPNFASISVGGFHACGLTADGTAYCWGQNNFGQVGDSSTTFRATPTPVAGGLKFSQISAGYQHTCARALSDGAVACWGRNNAGELGENTSPFETRPRFIVLGVLP